MQVSIEGAAASQGYKDTARGWLLIIQDGRSLGACHGDWDVLFNVWLAMSSRLASWQPEGHYTTFPLQFNKSRYDFEVHACRSQAAEGLLDPESEGSEGAGSASQLEQQQRQAFRRSSLLATAARQSGFGAILRRASCSLASNPAPVRPCLYTSRPKKRTCLIGHFEH